MLKSLRFTCLLIALSVCFHMGFGQTTYSVSSITYNPDPFTAGVSLNINQDDIWGQVVPLPFGFCFYDSSFTDIVVGSNGIVTFDTSVAGQFCNWQISAPAPDSSYQNYSIMAPYQDIFPDFNGMGVRFDVAGVAPYRRAIVSYYQIPMYQCNQMLFTEQVILYETTNIIEVHLEEKPLCVNWNGGVAILGMQKDATTGIVAPGRNHPTQWAAVNESWRFSPQGPCAGISPQNFVAGKVYADVNNNCTYDSGTDHPVANRSIHVDNGAYYAWTDAQGDYIIPLDTGNWVVGQVLSQYYATGCPASGTHSFSLVGPAQTFVAHFADSLLIACPDLSVDIGTANMSACFPEVIGITYCNDGTFPDSNVVLTITLDDSIQVDSATVTLTALPGNAFTFNIGNLTAGQCGSILLYATMGCDTPGTVYCMDAAIIGNSTIDCDTSNNTAQDCQALIASYDPNDKQVRAQNGLSWLSDEDILLGDGLSYKVRFQNTGSDTARSVVIRDTLSNLVDPATLTMGAASHSYNWTLIDGVLIIDFGNIMLPDSGASLLGSQGFVQYRIKQASSNVVGDLIENAAAIYFDFNAPIITNTTTNLIVMPVGIAPGAMPAIKVYPNPGRDQLAVDWPAETGDEFVLRTLTGQELRRVPLTSAHSIVRVADLPAGAYFYAVEREGQQLAAGKWLKL